MYPAADEATSVDGRDLDEDLVACSILLEDEPMERRPCKRCGQSIRVTPSHHLRAHDCPHGECCVPPYAERRQGARGGQCKACRAGRQLELFPGLL